VAWAGVIAVFSVAGCATFPLPTYEHIAQSTAARTAALNGQPVPVRTLNRAASLPGRSQAEVKKQLEALWNPKWRPGRLVNFSGLVATRYSQLDTKPGPAFRHATITVNHLGRESQINYIAAIHSGKRLPLVVASSGINATVDAKITVDILQELYDSGEFHVVHLESVTSVEHEERNGHPFGGGFPEGLLLYQTLAELRTHSNFAGEVSQVHVVGISFGGLLAGIAAHCEDELRMGVIDGAVLAFSPPLDLRQLFQNIAAFPYIHDRIHQSYLEAGLAKFEKQGIAHVDGDPKRVDFDDYIRMVAVPYVQRIYPALRAKMPEVRPIRTSDDLYAISSMRPYFSGLGVPYFFFYAYDDPVLSPDDHFHRMLADCANPLVDGILVPDGGHLGFDTLFDSPFTARASLEYFRYWSASRN
jgi:predicted alpha/beta-fold hydrolase